MLLYRKRFLKNLAKVLEKYVNRQVRLELETPAGKKVKLSGSAGEIKAVLEQLGKES